MKTFDVIATEFKEAQIISWERANFLCEKYNSLKSGVKSSWDEHAELILMDNSIHEINSRNIQRRILNNILYFFWTSVIGAVIYLLSLTF